MTSETGLKPPAARMVKTSQKRILMKRPTWVTVVGVLGIIFACLGILGAGQEMIMPKMLKMKKEMFTDFRKMIEAEMEKESANQSDNEGQHQGNAEFPVGMFNSFMKMFDFPEWYGTWSIISGILKLLISAFFLLASIRLLQLRPSSINLFYWAAGSSIALGVVKGAVALSGGSFIALAMMVGGVFGIIIDIILIIVVATGDKKAFYRQSPPPIPQQI
jgi:hypothetical protein